MTLNKSIQHQLLLVLWAAILFIPYIGKSHLFDWDEINFAECAREMILSGNYTLVQINFEPFWEKPPLFIWLQAFSMKIFGVSEFSSRLPNAVCGIATLLLVYNIGKKLLSPESGLLWALLFSGSILPHLYFKSGIIDPWFNLFIFTGIYQISNFAFTKKESYLVLSGLFIGLAILTKGPVALLLSSLTAFSILLFKREKKHFSFSAFARFIVYSCLIGSSWFIVQVLISGNLNLVSDFVAYQIRLLQTEDAGHGGPFYYHLVVLLLGCFPASFFCLKYFASAGKNKSHSLNSFFDISLALLLIITILVFSLVKTKILHYSSLAYFPITFFATKSLQQANFMKGRVFSILLLSGGILWSSLFALPWSVGFFKDYITNSDIINDPFVLANLSAKINWGLIDILPSVLLLLASTFIFLVRNKKNSMKQFLIFNSLSVGLLIILVVPKVEGYSQRAAIEFYQNHSKEDCYFGTIGFKSYAQYFYGRTNTTQPRTQELLDNTYSKKVYFVAKLKDVERIRRDFPQLEMLYHRNGFYFYSK